MTVRSPVRSLVHTGFISASALFFDTDMLGLEEARRRVIGLSEPGCLVYGLPDGYLVRLASPRLVDSYRAAGTPLVERAGLLWAAPPIRLVNAEDSGFRPAAVLIDAGLARVESLLESLRVDPADWLDLGGWQALELTPLGSPPAPPVPEAEKPVFDARRRLAGVPEAPEEQRQMATLLGRVPDGGWMAAGSRVRMGPVAEWFVSVLEQLAAMFERAPAEPQGTRGSSRDGTTGTHIPAGASSGERLLLILLSPIVLPIALFGILAKSFIDSIGGGSGARRAGGGAQPATQSAAAAGSARKPAAYRGLLGRMLMRTRLARFLGRKHAAYLMRMMEMFERGDLMEALRYGIPLGGDGDPAPALGSPKPRSDLSINPFQGGAASAFFSSFGLLDMIREHYRRAHAKLDGDGRVDEAAFVLAELLWETEEAVSYLERHGRLRLAAELAEGRELPPGMVVRQWFLAGDRDRAILIARRTGAFADAELGLQKTDATLARALRLLWANSLATAGDFAGAVEVVWRDPEACALAGRWLELCIEAGGVPAARLLPRKLEADPTSFPEVRDRVLAILGSDDPGLADERQALAEALRDAPRLPGIPPLARAAVRSVIRDAGSGLLHPSSRDLYQLLKVADDGALRSDLPVLPVITRQSLLDRSEAIQITIAPDDAGTLALFDAVPLPDGRRLLALGEAGLRLVSRSGKTVTHWDRPVHRLVISDHGNRAIGVAPRGSVGHLTRIDLLTQRAEPWCDVELGEFADTYDGSLWLAACGKHVVALDATAPEARSLWRRANIGPELASISRDPNHLALITREMATRDQWGNAVEPFVKWMSWNFGLPGFLLNQQLPIETPRPAAASDIGLIRAVSPAGIVADMYTRVRGGDATGDPIEWEWSLHADGWGTIETPLGKIGENMDIQIVSSGTWHAARCFTSAGMVCTLVHHATRRVRATVTLGGAASGFCRIVGSHLWKGDDRGRLLILDLETGEVTANRRIV